MALGDPYVTLALLKGYMNITSTSDDTELTAALNTASRMVEKYCRRQFNDAGSASPRVFQPNSHTLLLADDFSTDTGLVVEVDDSDAAAYGTTLTASDYTLEPANGVVDGETGWPYWRILAVNARWPVGHVHPSVRVTAQWGWAAVPDPVAQACKLLAADTFELKGAPFGIRSYGDYSMRVRDNPRAAMLLDPYRRDPVLVA